MGMKAEGFINSESVGNIILKEYKILYIESFKIRMTVSFVQFLEQKLR